MAEPPYHPLFGPYAGREPRFYPREATPWLATLEALFPVVRRELAAFLARGELAPNFDPYGFAIRGWRTLNFLTYGWPYPRQRAAFPETVAALDALPWVTSAFINLLEPHTRIPPHFGDSNAIWRAHLGLVVPGPVGRCGIEVGGERRGWDEGRAFAFCDAHLHHAWNDTDRPRIILLVDVLRPPYRPRADRVCGDVLAAIALTLARTRLPLLRRLPPAALRPAHRALGRAATLVLRARRRRLGLRWA